MSLTELRLGEFAFAKAIQNRYDLARRPLGSTCSWHGLASFAADRLIDFSPAEGGIAGRLHLFPVARRRELKILSVINPLRTPSRKSSG